MSDLLPIGTRIRFTKTIVKDATGDHPAFLLANEGDLGTVAAHYLLTNLYAYGVVTDVETGRFAVSGDEIEEMK